MPLTHQYVGTSAVGALTQAPPVTTTYVKKVTVPAGGLLSAVEALIDSVDAAAVSARFAVYADNGGVPGRLIGFAPSHANSVAFDGSQRRIHGPFGLPFAAETDIWVGVNINDAGGSLLRYDSVGGVTDYHIVSGGNWTTEAGASGASQTGQTRDYGIRASIVEGLGFATVGDVTPGASLLAMAIQRTYMKKVTLAAGDLLSTIDVHLSQPVANVPGIWPVIWADNAGAPGTLLHVGANETASLLLSNNLRTLSIPVGFQALTAGDYWIGIRQAASSTSLSISYDTTGGSDGFADTLGDNPAFTSETTRYAIGANRLVYGAVSRVGNTVPGASQQLISSFAAYCIPITLPNDGFVFAHQASIITPGGAGFGDPKAALYADDAGQPGELLAWSGRRQTKATIGSTRRTINQPLMIWVPAGDYWVGYADNGGSGAARLDFDVDTEGATITVPGALESAVVDPGATGAVIAGGEDAYTEDVVYFDATGAAPPDPPIDVTAIAISSSAIRVDWSAMSGATGYRVERSDDGIGGWADVSGPITDVTYTDGGLTPSTTYFYRVVAFNDNGDSGPSSVVSATTFPEATPIPNPTPGEGWLRHPDEAANLDMAVCVTESYTRTRPFSAIQPIGGGLPTVVTGVAGGRDYTLVITTRSIAEQFQLEQILESPIVYYQPPCDRDVWVAPDQMSIQVTKVKRIRQTTVTFVEVLPQPQPDPESFFELPFPPLPVPEESPGESP